MAGVAESSPYREALIGLIVSLDRAVSLTEPNQVLLVLTLDTEEKIIKFSRWVRNHLTGENEVQATETEIMRAAVQIGKGIL